MPGPESGLSEIRIALLEADVAIPVVKDLIARIKEKALGVLGKKSMLAC